MDLILTNHAKKRMTERNVSLSQIKETISFPDYTIRKDNKVEAYKSFNNQSLKVIHVEKGKFIKIITLIWI